MESQELSGNAHEVDYMPSSRLSVANVPVDDKQKPICHECQQPIMTTQFIRVGGVSFHKEHFQCHICKVLLHDQKPRFKDGHFYCNEDFRNKFCHTCNKCGEKILEGSVVRALGNYYHQDHFVCTVCEQPFKDGKYYDFEGRPYCLDHYGDQKLEICAKCQKPIQDIDVVSLNGSSYHVSCLKCNHCGIPLAGKGSIFQKQGEVYCRDDYLNLFSKMCTACGKHIMKHILAVNDEFYHPDCLKCQFCNVPLAQYIVVQGYLRCEHHFETEAPPIACTVCTQPIVNEDPILSAGHKVHSACFNCFYCSKQLVKEHAKNKDGRLCCSDCLMQTPHSQAASNPPSVSVTSLGSPISVPTPITTPASLSVATPTVMNNQSALASPTPVSSYTPAPAPAPVTPVTPTVPAPSNNNNGGNNGNGNGNGSSNPNGTTSSSELLDNEFSNCNISWKRGDVIGKGSFGKVFLGMNSNTGELLAIKQIPIKENLDLDVQQIVTEIKLMENLRHSNIVTLLGTQRTGNKLNIIMEYVAGNSIDCLLAKFGPFAENVIQSYTRQLLDALAYCHKNGVVHRDLKGKNVLVDTNGNLKLADFGSAKRFQDVLMNDAPSLGYNYTPLWTAPEVLTGDYNSKVDIWSLGCVVIEMATAKSPWHEWNFEHAFRALNHIASCNSIPRLPSNLSPDGRDFLVMCLQRNPDERPTAQQLLSHRWVARKDHSLNNNT